MYKKIIIIVFVGILMGCGSDKMPEVNDKNCSLDSLKILKEKTKDINKYYAFADRCATR